MGNMRSAEDVKTRLYNGEEAKNWHNLTLHRHSPQDVEMIGKEKETSTSCGFEPLRLSSPASTTLRILTRPI